MIEVKKIEYKLSIHTYKFKLQTGKDINHGMPVGALVIFGKVEQVFELKYHLSFVSY